MKSSHGLLVLAFLIFSGCAHHREMDSQTTENSTLNSSIFSTLISSFGIAISDDFDIILPKNPTALPPISGQPSKETSKSDTIHLRRRSSIIAHRQDTTSTNAITTHTHNQSTHTEGQSSNTLAITHSDFTIVYWLQLACVLLIIIFVYFPFRDNKHKQVN